MTTSPPLPEPSRPADLARLEIAKLRVEDGVTLDVIFRKVTEAAATVLNVERAGIWLLTDQGRSLRCVDLYELSKGTHSEGITIRVEDFPDYFEALARWKTVPAEIAATDHRTSTLTEAYFEPLGITSVLDAGIFVGGEVIGVLCNEQVGPPCEWTTEARDFAGSMADVLALKIRAAELEETRSVLRTQANQLADSRRLDCLAEMAAGIAHDLNNILAVVISDADLIANCPSAGREINEAANRIYEVGQRGVSLSKELMAFARPSSKSARVVRPAEVIVAQKPLLEAAAGDEHPLELQLHSTAGRVLISPAQLERLMLNLIINARDASPAGTPITIVVESCEAQEISIAPGHFLRISVSDQGQGIPQELLNKIFDPFFSTKPRGRGTGLGLTVVDQIVKHAGGYIRVDSAVGQGTSVRIYLPRVSSQA